MGSQAFVPLLAFVAKVKAAGIMAPLLALALGFGIAAFVLPFVIRLAHRNGWIVLPRKDRWHRRPTAMLGGLGIFAGWIGALAGVVLLKGQWPPLWLVGGGFVLLVTGVFDDLRELNPMQKLIAQVGTAVLPLLFGLAFGDRLPGVVAIPLTLLWVVGVTNAVNLIDGMDGLAGGIAAIAALVLGVSALVVHDVQTAVAAFALAGACLGFLVYNFQPARIFMGDGGSLFLGYVLAALALQVQQLGEATTDRLVLLALPIVVLAVPIFDTTLVTMMRALNGRRLTQGGNDHLMHRLVHLGLSERRTVVLLYAVSLAYGALALGLLLLHPALAAALGGLIAMVTLAVGFNVASADVYAAKDASLDPEAPAVSVRWGRMLQRFLGREWKAMFGLVVDLIMMSAVSVLVAALHTRQGIPLAPVAGAALAIQLSAKLVAFYVGGLYRGIWRYAGTPELVRIVLVGIAATCASGLAVLVFSDASPVPGRVLPTDALLTVISLAAVRFGLRGSRQLIWANRTGGQRTLLYGAGDGGLLMLREIRQNHAHGYRPVGFLDDDPFKHGMKVQGLPVMGGLQDLEGACARAGASLVLITARRMTAARQQAIVDACAQVGVECHAFTMRVEKLYVPEDPATQPLLLPN